MHRRPSYRSAVCAAAAQTADRVNENEIPLAQNKLAEMLGAQRTTVNQVVHGLQSAGVIYPYRGGIRIAEREELERRACECYGWVQSNRLMLLALPGGKDSVSTPKKV